MHLIDYRSIKTCALLTFRTKWIESNRDPKRTRTRTRRTDLIRSRTETPMECALRIDEFILFRAILHLRYAQYAFFHHNNHNTYYSAFGAFIVHRSVFSESHSHLHVSFRYENRMNHRILLFLLFDINRCARTMYTDYIIPSVYCDVIICNIKRIRKMKTKTRWEREREREIESKSLQGKYSICQRNQTHGNVSGYLTIPQGNDQYDLRCSGWKWTKIEWVIWEE